MSIFFLHIPKTAGTSVYSIIEDNVSIEDAVRMKRVVSAYNGGTLDFDMVRKAGVIAGHIPLEISCFMEYPVRRIVFLRDPRSQILSTVNHFRRSGEIDPDASLDDLLNSDYMVNFENIQVKWLVSKFLSNYRVGRISTNLGTSFAYGIRDLGARVDDQDLVRAKANLEKFDFIGIVEKMDESLARMRHKFGFNETVGDIRLNSGEYISADEPALNKFVENKCLFDLELYKFGLELFKRNASSDYIPRDPDSRFHTRDKGVLLDMDVAFRHEGFHRREIWPHWYGVRWTSERAAIILPCTIEPNVTYEFELAVPAAISYENIREVILDLNGLPIYYNIIKHDGVHYYCGVFTTGRMLMQPTLSIKVPFAKRPSDGGNSPDNRVLGLAVKSFRMMPSLSLREFSMSPVGV